VIVAETLSQVSAPAELSLVGKAYVFHPAAFPLRAPIQFRLDQLAEPPTGELGLYQDSGDGWEFVRSRYDPTTRGLEAESRRLGRVAIFRDTTPPRIKAHRARPGPAHSPYPRWDLETQLQDDGSGIEAQSSYFEVDGQHVPSEWDPEANTLRWRPHSGPGRGTHRYQVIAQDRSGNIARASGTFVLD